MSSVRRAATVAVIAACALGIVGCATEVDGVTQPATAHPGPSNDAGATLEALLLDDRDIARITEAPSIQTVGTYAAMPGPSRRQYSDEVCDAAISAASTSTYGGTSFTDIRGRRLRDSDDDGDESFFTRAVDQAVILFPNEEAARAFVTTSQRDWAACTGTTVEPLDDGEDQSRWRVGQSNVTRGVLSITADLASGWSSQHAVSAQGNVVIDVSVTMLDVGDQASIIVRRIGDRFSQ